jgi:phosphohistidine phosphatase
MRRLALLRHGKAAKGSGVPDFDRPLTSEGWEEAGRAGARLAAMLPPERIFCSSARRARETLAAILQHFENDLEIKLMRALYEVTTASLMHLVGEFGDDAGTVLIIGHNPFLEEAASLLTIDGERGPAARHPLATAGSAVLAFESSSWREIRPGTGRLLRPGDTVGALRIGGG